MALTADQDIPNKPIPNEPWTFRKLFSSGGKATTTLAKVFVTPSQVLLAVLVLTLVAMQLLGKQATLGFQAFTFLVLIAVFFEQHKDLFFGSVVEEQKPPKPQKHNK